MAVNVSTFENFLSQCPTVRELIEHIDIGSRWHTLGTMLEIDSKRLNGIEELPGKDDVYKTTKMFELWLTTTPTAARTQVLEALRKRVVSENKTAQNYENYLKKLHDSTYTPPSVVAYRIVQSHCHTLNEVIISPIQMSQLLYSQWCISEATLNEIETDQSRSLDDKKTTLLTAIQEVVSGDYRKLEVFANVLSSVEETRGIGNKLLNEYALLAQKAPNDNTLPDAHVSQEVHVVSGSNENRACHILRKNHHALSKSLNNPIAIAKSLHKEVLSKEALICVESTGRTPVVCKAVLLKAVRDAIHSNYKHLELFVTVLRKSTHTVDIANIIFEEYKVAFPKGGTISELKCHQSDEYTCESASRLTHISSGECFVPTGGEIYIPEGMSPAFSEIRRKFGSTFYKVRRAIEGKNINPDEMKLLLGDCFPVHKSQFANESLTSVHDILEVVKEKCTLIDINCLEVVVEQFDVKDAMNLLVSYKKVVDDFCTRIACDLCLNETLQVVRSPQPLQSETLVFVLSWSPANCTLDDIRHIVAKSICVLDVQVRLIGDHRSITVTCFVPKSLTGQVIAAILNKIELLKTKGLKELVVDDTTVWENEVVKSEVSHLKGKPNKKMSRTVIKVPVVKSMSHEFSSIRSSFARMFHEVRQCIKRNPPPLEELKLFLSCGYHNLKHQIDESDNLSSVLRLIEHECTLIDISVLQAVVEEFRLTEAMKHIEEYENTLKVFCQSLSTQLRLKERVETAPTYSAYYHETGYMYTYIFDWEPDEYKLKDITALLSKSSSRPVKIKYV